MRTRNLLISLAAVAAVAAVAADVSAQTNPRFGVWQMQSDAPPPS